MPRPTLVAAAALAIAVVGCAPQTETMIKVTPFPDTDPEFSKERAIAVCENRAEQAGREEARHMSARTNDEERIAGVRQAAFMDEAEACFAEKGYQIEVTEVQQ